jgi:predicted dehydrogenase
MRGWPSDSMSSMDAQARTTALVWLSGEQTELARAALERAGVLAVLAGSPDRGQTRGVADALGCDAADDLRAAITETQADLVLLMSPGDFGADPSRDARCVRGAAQRRTRFASMEPIPASALEVSDPEEGPGLGELIRPVPMPRSHAVWRDASEVLSHFGAVRTAAVSCFAEHARGDGSLGAQLVAALDLLHGIMGEPETIDASYAASVGAYGAGSVSPSSPPGETLRGLHGDVTGNLRFSSGRTAAIAVSDQGGRFCRQTTILGEGGRLRVFDDGFEWIGADGEKIDQHRASTREDPRPRNHAVEALADAIKRLCDPNLAEPPGIAPAVLAMAQAAILSARTGQRESPETIRRMAGA